MSAISNVAATVTQQTQQTTAASYSKESSAPKKSSDAKTSDNKKSEEQAAVYEKSPADSDKKATYSINRMSEKDRAALVDQLKADQEMRQSQLIDLVKQTLNGQGKAFSLATGDDSIWKFLASGDFEVDPATKAQAQADISEDGYWGVKQTSQRLFDFASALAGDDVEKMEKMQAAIKKGFDQATGAWGRNLPDISTDTLNATDKLFEDYFASKKAE